MTTGKVMINGLKIEDNGMLTWGGRVSDNIS